MYYLLLLYINKQGVVSLRSVRRGTPSSMARTTLTNSIQAWCSSMCHGLPWILMSVICTMLMPLYHLCTMVHSQFIYCLFVKAFKFNVSVVHLCQDCKKSPGENISQWFTRLASSFTFDLLCFEERNWLDISCTEKDEPQILVYIFPRVWKNASMKLVVFLSIHHCHEQESCCYAAFLVAFGSEWTGK